MQPSVDYDLDQMQRDMVLKGWQATDLALRAGVSKATVSRFFDGSYQTLKTAGKLAKALGYSVKRYVRLRARAS